MKSKEEFDRAKEILGELEQLIAMQNAPYLVHVERLSWLKYLHTRLEKLKDLEEATQDRAEKSI
jgi:hypothetical protein